MLVVVVLTMMSSYAVNGKVFTIGYVWSDVFDNHELRGSAIIIAIESFQENGWLQDHEIK